jgi:Fic family protein
MKYKGVKDMNNKKVLEFLCESNFIEGINIDLQEYKKTKPTQKSVINSIQAWDFIKDIDPKNTEYSLQDIIKQTHAILSRDGMIQQKYKGAYRDCDVYIGNNMGTSPNLIEYEMTQLVEDCKNKLSKNKIWEIHDRFEITHPFVDYNGRVGRILLNWLRVQNGFPIYIVRFTNRFEYYEKINKCRDKIIGKHRERMQMDYAMLKYLANNL